MVCCWASTESKAGVCGHGFLDDYTDESDEFWKLAEWQVDRDQWRVPRNSIFSPKVATVGQGSWEENIRSWETLLAFVFLIPGDWLQPSINYCALAFFCRSSWIKISCFLHNCHAFPVCWIIRLKIVYRFSSSSRIIDLPHNKQISRTFEVSHCVHIWMYLYDTAEISYRKFEQSWNKKIK